MKQVICTIVYSSPTGRRYPNVAAHGLDLVVLYDRLAQAPAVLTGIAALLSRRAAPGMPLRHPTLYAPR